MKKKIRCIHFDLDSVLYVPSDFLETALQMSVNAMIQVGLRAEQETALSALKTIRSLDSNGKDHFNQLCFHFNNEYDPIIIAAGVEKYWDCKISLMTSAPEAHPILSFLYSKYPLTIITNGPPIKQAGKVIRLSLNHFFSRYDNQMNLRKHYFYASDESEKRKPYPNLWLQAQKDMGFDFSRAIMVGDRYLQDIFGAKRLGMITVKVNQGAHADEAIDEAFEAYQRLLVRHPFFSKEHSLEQVRSMMIPDYTISHLKELEGVVDAIEAA
jgi:HAD superfamily hydrolase (TIGR01662 family)